MYLKPEIVPLSGGASPYRFDTSELTLNVGRKLIMVMGLL